MKLRITNQITSLGFTISTEHNILWSQTPHWSECHQTKIEQWSNEGTLRGSQRGSLQPGQIYTEHAAELTLKWQTSSIHGLDKRKVEKYEHPPWSVATWSNIYPFWSLFNMVTWRRTAHTIISKECIQMTVQKKHNTKRQGGSVG